MNIEDGWTDTKKRKFLNACRDTQVSLDFIKRRYEVTTPQIRAIYRRLADEERMSRLGVVARSATGLAPKDRPVRMGAALLSRALSIHRAKFHDEVEATQPEGPLRMAPIQTSSRPGGTVGCSADPSTWA